MGDKTVKPKYLPEDFATEPKDNAEAADRHRIAQARAILEAPIVAVNGMSCRHVELNDGTFRDIPLDDIDPDIINIARRRK